jgi:parvulin-like peptidyl-prolyl isomerase
MIMWPKNQRNIAVVAYPRIRDSAEEFDKAARSQATASLAAKDGDVVPFSHHTTGNLEMETAAFALKPGELSQMLETDNGIVVLKCVELIPASHEKTLDEVRAALTGDIINRKINQYEIPNFFAELRRDAHPQILTKEGAVGEDLMSEVRRDLQDAPPGSPK